MDVLKIENNYSHFLSDNADVKEAIYNALRFREKGYYHNRRYKMKLWDGYTNFFHKATGKFLTGLLPEVKTILKIKKIQYQTLDIRNKIGFVNNSIPEDFLNGKTLRDYQIEYIEKIALYKRGIIDAFTGVGKTLIMSGIIKNLPDNTPTLVLCNRKSLVEQNYNELTSFGIKNVGRVYDKYKEPNIITCSTIQSSVHLEKILPTVKALIVDEVHLLSSGKAKKLYAKLKNCYVRVGLSATPFKDGGRDECQKYLVKGWIGPVIPLENSTDNGMLTLEELQQRNILSTVNCTFFRVSEPKLEYEVYLDAVTKGIAQNSYLNNKVANLAKSLTGRTLILVDRIEHGDRLKELIPNAHWIQGKDNMETRKFVIEQLSNASESIGIASSAILSVGINVWVNNMINCTDSKAEHIIMQAIGRGLRVKNDKKHLSYYDFLFEINTYLQQHSKSRIRILRDNGYIVNVAEFE